MSKEPNHLRENRDVYPSIYRREDHYTGLNWRVDLPVPFTLGDQRTLMTEALNHSPDVPRSRRRWSVRKDVARFPTEKQAMAVAKALVARTCK